MITIQLNDISDYIEKLLTAIANKSLLCTNWRKLSDLGLTYRDVLDDLATATIG